MLWPEYITVSETDERLLARILKGDEPAFTELYRRRQGPIYRFALHMTHSVAAAEDVTQETFLTLMESGRRFDSARGTVLSFLFGIARNHVWRRIEKDSRTEPVEAIEEYARGARARQGEALNGGQDLMEVLTRRETVELVRCAVRSLPDVYREVVVLCDLESLSYEEASVVLICPIGTVRSRLNRARAILAQKLASHAVRNCV
jgi:RNA polymerase sigma-70 factor (ECF subfamily)